MKNSVFNGIFITALSPVIALCISIIASGTEQHGETLVQLLIPDPDGRNLPVKIHGGMILASGALTPTPLVESHEQVLGLTDGITSEFQGVLDHASSPGTLTISDGFRLWIQGSGSSDSNFSVTYSASSRNVLIIYPENPPETGLNIVASYSRDIVLPTSESEKADFRLKMIRNYESQSPSISSHGERVQDGDRFDLEISGDLVNWERVPLSSSFLTESGAIRLSNHIFTQRRAILNTDGASQIFLGIIPEIVEPGTLTISDGVYTWAQTNGSSNPEQFTVTYAQATRSLAVAYPMSVPQEGRTIQAIYDVEVRNSLATFVRLNSEGLDFPEGFALNVQKPRPFTKKITLCLISSSATLVSRPNPDKHHASQTFYRALDRFRRETCALPLCVTHR